jgi:hypothetical protein
MRGHSFFVYFGFVNLSVWVGLVAMGCTSNTFRSPAFVGQTVAEPTVSTVVVKCLAEKHVGTDKVADSLTAELRAGGDVAPLDGASRVTICGELGSDTALSTLAADWDVGGQVVGPIAQSLAKRYGGKSVLLPIVRTVDSCMASTVGSAAGCKEQRVDIGLFLYGADGVPLWRGVTHVAVPQIGSFDPKLLEGQSKSALADVPAKRMGKLPVPQTD